jgi:hypothetical protein
MKFNKISDRLYIYHIKSLDWCYTISYTQWPLGMRWEVSFFTEWSDQHRRQGSFIDQKKDLGEAKRMCEKHATNIAETLIKSVSDD